MTTCWIVVEKGLTGTKNQCVGVANALGINPVIKEIGLRQPWKSLSPWLPFENEKIFTGAPLTAPWPDLVLASGRKSIAASRYIKEQSGGKTFTVQIQDPRISPKHFDLVAVPEHDPTRGPNVIVTQATPNRVTKQLLDESKEKFKHLFEPLPSPRIAVLIGGNSRSYTMTEDIMRHLAANLSGLDRQDMGLMVTVSRRTGEKNQKILEDALNKTNAFVWNGYDENPYYGMLAWADYIIVTADSASMISEAATTGKPVYIVPLSGGSARFDNFHANLFSKGIIRNFEGRLEPYSYAPLDDANLVAKTIHEQLKAV